MLVFDVSFGANFVIWCPKYASVGSQIGRVIFVSMFRLAPILRFAVHNYASVGPQIGRVMCFFDFYFSFGANFAIRCPKYAGVGHRIGRVMLFLIFRLAQIL